MEFNRNQKITLICSGVFYLLTLFSFLKLDSWIFLICFILHSLAIMAFAFLTYRESLTSPDEIEELSERIVNIKADWKEESESLKATISEKDENIASLKNEISALEDKSTELNDEIKRLEKENADTIAASMEKSDTPDPSSILPQFLPERSESTTVNIIDVARSVSREFHDDAAKAGLNISISATDEVLLVKADQNMIRVLFRNIVDNSIKYMNRHGSLIITVSAIGDDIFVVCKDTGEGLAAEETEHIFELNYQGSNRISGNGLGLFQAKAIVEYYGGTIYAKSTSGQGMGIYIQLPTT